MLPLSWVLYPILLVLGFLLNTAQTEEVTLGYRTVSPEEAAFTNIWRKPSPENFDAPLPHQLGDDHFYMTNVSPGEAFLPDDWYCIIKADVKALSTVGKIWIPEYYPVARPGGRFRLRMLWGNLERRIVDYIRMFLPNPERALRFSWVQFFNVLHEPLLQMVIPTQLLREDTLRLWAYCVPTAEMMLNYSRVTVDWPTWNIEGEPGEAPISIELID
ncbi:hypothetical protein MBM_00946 [Drepanopeziza brunnea f. sp. 'multigermtubi' MB_m1]|uniref:Uncharacterized protein n=1 Tax=Marssonina brunnea f. sp. multigermtubi (strain MB_m1) TaxID=1072389 RepID=K1XMS1_MARBU|nr:uncharacterized protein MBM_00946 [Drepanopeziza brunnea f. sp. 'multigermtubi' MB_m1]EKD21833.1 hypothetical protein MBM_00946 [Drepanopeziza brunnea f. sp. 'multigermtubi' MB_m1]